jgi:hypothetical protein
MYSYKRSEPSLWTVGLVEQEDGRDVWLPESDHNSAESAASRVAFLNGGSSPDYNPVEQRIPGLTKRDYFASLILSGIAQKCIETGFKPNESSLAAIALADALIEELAK